MNDSIFVKGSFGEYRISGSSFSAGCIARESNRIDYTMQKEEIRVEEKALVSKITGADLSRIFFLDQDHKDVIIDIDAPAPVDQYCAGVADALTTSLKGFVLVIRTADCVPVIIHDRARDVIAAVHSGWRSSALDICEKTVRHMGNRYGTNPSDCDAFILPSISVRSYQVSRDVADRFPGCVRETKEGLYLDLNRSVNESLIQSGVPVSGILNTGYCTYIDNDMFFSHRRGDKARDLNFIVLNAV